MRVTLCSTRGVIATGSPSNMHTSAKLEVIAKLPDALVRLDTPCDPLYC